VKKPTIEEQREMLRRREKGYEIMAKLRRDELRGKPYNFEEVDAVLSLADHYDGQPRLTSGLIEQQRLFMKHPDHPCNREKKG